MDDNVTIIYSEQKEEFSTIILDNSKGQFALRKKLQLCFDPSHPTSPVI